MHPSKLLFLLLFSATLVLPSCRKKGPDVSSVAVDFNVVPFFIELHGTQPDSIAAKVPYFKQKYGSFLEGYSLRVIKIGSPNAPEYAEYLRSFVEYQANRDVFDKCKPLYANLTPLRTEIEQAYKYYRHFYPTAQLPDVYLQISGFNQSMVIDSGLVAVSVEKYLGADCKFYDWLEYPLYLRKKMVPQKIVPDIMKAIAISDYPYNDSIDDVVNNMVYQGKVLHFVKSMCPEINDTLLFDFTDKQLEWCLGNESKMWSVLVEKRLLFDNNRNSIQKFIGETPFTTFFGQDSPGRAATWLGYRLVDAYLSQNPTVTLTQLMAMPDGHQILAGSGYRP